MSTKLYFKCKKCGEPDGEISQIIEDAYRKGEENMRERAAEVVIKEHETCQEWGCEISNKILSLPLTEGGAR